MTQESIDEQTRENDYSDNNIDPNEDILDQETMINFTILFIKLRTI